VRETKRVKCNYRKRRKATVWPFLRRSAAPAVAGLLLAAAACSSRWGGSVGAILGKNNQDGRLYVRELPPEMGASKAGMHVGDEITAIGGERVEGMSPEEVHAALAGKVGTKVRLKVVRDGQILEIEVERGPLRQ